VVVLTQVRACRVGACSASVPSVLSTAGICLAHHLDEVFTRVSTIQERWNEGKRPDLRTIQWLARQGDLAVTLLSGDGPESADDRSRLLELLLCLANLHESLRDSPQTHEIRKKAPR
jgi:hypothetical protein